MAESLNRAVRNARRRRTSQHVPCTECGKRIWAKKGTKPGLCYECQARAAGKGTSEVHHILDRGIDPNLTVEVPGNLHRDLSELQLDWPPEVRKNRANDPILIAMAVL